MTVISADLRVISDVFCEVLSQGKNIVEEIELIVGARAEWSSPLQVCILGHQLGPSRVSPNQRSRWKLVFSQLKQV